MSAENGTTTTYTITVVCGSAAATGSTTTTADTATSSESDETDAVEGEVTSDSTDDADADESADEASGSAVTFDSNGYLIYEGESYMPSSMMPEGDYVSLDKYNKLYEQNQSQKSKYMRMVIILAVLLLVACIAILNLALKLRDFKQDAKLGLMDIDDEDDEPVRRGKRQEQKRIHKRSAATETQTDMIPDLELPQSMTAEPAKAEKPMKTEKTVKPEKTVKSYRASHTAPDSDDLEILDLNDL